jgi:hypothetical protein
MIKSFEQYLNEASLGGNPGIPGEGGKSGSYRLETEMYSKQQVRDLERRYGPKMAQLPMLANRLRELQSGHEKDLEKLAEKAIRSLYGRMIEDVTLDIKFPQPGEIPKMMEDVPDASPKILKIPKIEELKDKDIISEIQKRKIINNITQGEAVNSKKALNLPEVIEGMKKIMGDEKAKEYIKLSNEVSDIAQAYYWIIPVEVQERMWKTNKEGMSGVVGVDWEEKTESEEDLAKKILDSLNKDGDLPKEETEELFYETQPTIKARGKDFSMLIHETVKGVYELIAAIAIPDGEEVAGTVLMNTDSLADEIEDLRYGPKIASDIRDYLNTFPEVQNDEVPNLREHIMGKLYIMDAPEFLDVILSILNGDNRHRRNIEGIIKDVIKEIRDFELEGALGDFGIDNDDDYMPEPQGKKDYSQMDNVDLKRHLDDALDRRDFDEARIIHSYIKESKEADEAWALIHTYGGYPSNSDPSQINESEEFNDLYKGTVLTMDVIDGKTREKKGTIKTKINEMVLEGNSYFLRCSGDVNIVYDKDTQEFVEGYKPQYLVYQLDESNSQILDFLK